MRANRAADPIGARGAPLPPNLHAVAFVIGPRSKATFANLPGPLYGGWPMNDGYVVNRYYPKRLRCRSASPLHYLQQEIASGRQGHGTAPLPAIPRVVGGVKGYEINPFNEMQFGNESVNAGLSTR